MATHELKCDPGPFLDLLAGKKHCEVRRDDRGFREGDRLWLRETSLSAQGNAILRQEARYTGRELYRTITHIQRGYGLPDGIAVLSVSPAPASASQPGGGEACPQCNGHRWIARGNGEDTECEACIVDQGEAVDVHSLLRDAADQRAARAEQLPTEQDCIRLMVQIRLRLAEMGWNFATYAPKDGSSFEAIVAGFTGPSECKWFGSGFFVADKGDWWPATPFMFRKMPLPAAPSAGNGEAKGGRE